ncbi:MAG: TolC family protein [Ignavibacteria bacterium]|nr:TolC family protein [Ignavibacteria bacterium]
MTRILIYLAVLSMLLPGITISQEKLKLSEAINIALENNTTVSSLRKSLQIQELSTSSTRGQLYPDLSLNAGWTRNNTFSDGTVRFENGAPIIIPAQDSWINSFRLGLSTQVTIFDGFKNYSRVDLQKQNEQTIRIDLDKQMYDIAFSVNSAYFDVLKKEKVVGANEENLKDSQLQLERINEFLNVGKRTIADVYRQDVQVAQNELALERSKNELNKSKVDLLRAMNVSVDREIALEDQSIRTELSEAEIKMILERYSNTDQLYNQAVQKRYDYKAGIQQINTSKKIYEIDNKAVYWPSILGFANYSLNSANLGDITKSRSFNFGFSMNYPIFQGFNLSNKAQSSEIAIKQKQDNLRLLEIQIKSEIRKAYYDLETQFKQIEILQRNIKSAEQDKLLSEENYRVGFGILLDVQTASVKLNLLKIDLINAYYDFLLAERQIQYYTGGLLY